MDQEFKRDNYLWRIVLFGAIIAAFVAAVIILYSSA